MILNWNGRHYLEQFLPSVLATAYENFEVIIVDNGSTDDSLAFLNSAYPTTRTIVFNQNYGFAKGYNEALKQVTSNYYALVNSDVEVQPNWLNPIIELLEKDKSNVACQPKILSYKNRDMFDYAGGAGGWLDSYGYPFARGRVFDICEKDQGQYDAGEEVFWTSGAAMVIKSEVFHEMKGFDEYFFAHQEEIDLCWRMQLAGYKLFACPESTIYHVGGGTLPRGNTLKTFLNFRNNQVMLYKNLPWSQKWWKIPFRMLLDAISAWKGLLIGDAGYYLAILRAHLSFAKWLITGRKKSIFPLKRDGKLHGVYQGNLVWQHFIKHKKYFSELIK